jgi:tetratricopeptide (TPR) repeat protein
MSAQKEESVKSRALAFGAAVALSALTFGSVAHARNPHCAGGIQYVTQGLRDKVKDPESYKRQMLKAVDQLNQCASEDPADLEAIGYLGWAYAELDSAALAGAAFEKAITGMKAKGDKKLENVVANRESYYVAALNNGIGKINAAQTTWPEFKKEPANDAEKALKAKAAQSYEEARASLVLASKYKPNDPMPIRNLGSVYAFTGDYVKADETFQRGLQVAPGDSALTAWLRLVRQNHARRLTDEKKFDEALAFYGDLSKADASNADLHLGLADTYFRRAQSKEGDARKPDFKLAADEYVKASDLKGGDSDMLFNSALAYQSAGDVAGAEKQWRAFLKIKPNDTDAMSALASALSDQKKYDEGVQLLVRALEIKPQDKTLHRQLGGVYAKAGNNGKSYEHMVVYLALEKGADKDKPNAPAGSAAAQTLAKEGSPELTKVWEGDGEKYETLMYWKKKNAYTFKNGVLAVKTDWSSPGKTSTASSKGK